MQDKQRDDAPPPGRMREDGAFGEFTTTQPNRAEEGAGKRGDRQRIDHDDPVEEASDESFPASDPPAYTGGTSG